MADSNREIKNLEKLKKDEERLLALQKERTEEKKKLHHMQEKQLKRLQDEIVLKKKDIEETKKANKEYLSFSNSYKKLTQDVQKQLKGNNEKTGTFLSLGRQIANQKAKEARYVEDTTDEGVAQYKAAQNRKSILEDISSNLLSQAKATQQAEDKLKGVSSIEQQIRDFKAEAAGTLSTKQIELGEEVLKQTDALRQKEKRLVEIKQEQSNLFSALPDSIQSMVGGAKKFGGALTGAVAPLVLISAIAIAALSSFTKLDEAAESFRNETGMTNSQMGELKSDANDLVYSFSNLGVEAKDVFDSVSALRSEFSDIVKPSKEVVSSMVVLSKNFGVSAATGAKVQGIFEQVGGLSSETAASVQMQVVQMAKLAGVAPAKIMEDIAENAEIASTLFKGDVESLTQAAIEARRLGTNLKSVATTTEHLLDFQGNIGDELVAATFVGGQFNLTQARSLAAAGKTVEAQKEVLRQLERGGKFRDKDYFTQQQLAKAAGMSVEEINKQLNAQEKLNSLSSDQRKLAEEAISQGLDISDINKDQLASQVQQFSKQKEMKGQVEALGTAFTAIAASIGTAIVPLLQGMFEVLNPIFTVVGGIFGFLNSIPGVLPAIIAGLTTMYIMTKKAAIVSFFKAIPNIFSAFTGLGPVGIPLAVGAVAGLASLMSKPPQLGTADDMMGVPSGYGNTMVTTAGKGTIALNNNDSFLAGTNLGGGGGTPQWAERLITATEKQRDTYLDGRRVTSNISRVVDSSTKNNFAQGFS